MDAADKGEIVYVSGVEVGGRIPEVRGIVGEETGDLLNAIDGPGICRVERVLGLAWVPVSILTSCRALVPD